MKSTSIKQSCCLALVWSMVGCGQAQLVDAALAAEQAFLGSDAQPLLMYAPELGRGSNASLTRTYAQCVKYEQVKTTALNPNLALFTELLVRDRTALTGELQWSSIEAARRLWFAPENSMEFMQSMVFNAEIFHWLIHASYAVEKRALVTTGKGLKLTAMALQQLSENGLRSFYEMCGTKFLSGQTMGAQYDMVYAFDTLRSPYLKQATFAAANKREFGLSQGGNFTKVVEFAEQAGRLQINRYWAGVGAMPHADAKNPNQLITMLGELHAQAFNQGQVVPLQWSTSDYDIFAEVKAAQKTADPQQIVLFNHANAIETLYQTWRKLEDWLAPAALLQQESIGELPYVGLVPSKQHQLRHYLADLQTAVDDAAWKVQSCLATSDFKPCNSNSAVPSVSMQTFSADANFNSLRDWQIDYSFNANSPYVELAALPLSVKNSSSWATFDSRGVLQVRDANLAQPAIVAVYDGVDYPIGLSAGMNLCEGAFADRCAMRLSCKLNEASGCQPYSQRVVLTLINPNDQLPAGELIFYPESS